MGKNQETNMERGWTINRSQKMENQTVPGHLDKKIKKKKKKKKNGV